MKTESYTIGDIVRKTPTCTKQYPNWKIDECKIVSINMKTISDDALFTTERGRFRERYTYQSSYPIFEMIIEFFDIEANLRKQYLVTQFDFNKD